MTDIVNFNAAYIKIGDFDSRRRYMRRDLIASASAFDMPLGFTIQIARSGGPARSVVYRYSVNGYVVQQTNSFGPTLSFNATTIRARI